MHCIYRNCLNTFWHSNIGVFKNNMLWFVCFVLKYILPVCDGPKEDLQESTLYFFLPLYAKHMENVVNTRFLKEGIDIVILGVVESQLCTTGWQEVKIRGTGITLPCWSLHYFGLNVKQISSALTRPTGTWLEPASLALPWLTPPQQIMDPTWISSGWGGWICAPKHKTACINDTLPFTHLMKKKKKVYWTWSYSQVRSEITCAGLFFSPFPPSFDFMASTHSTCFPFSRNKMGCQENNLVCLFPRR